MHTHARTKLPPACDVTSPECDSPDARKLATLSFVCAQEKTYMAAMYPEEINLRLHDKIETLECAKRRLLRTNKALRCANRKLSTECDDWERQSLTLLNNFKESEADRDRLTDQNERLDAYNTELKAELEQLEYENLSLLTANNEMANTDYEVENDKLLGEKIKLEDENAKLQTSLDLAVAEIESLKEQLKTATTAPNPKRSRHA